MTLFNEKPSMTPRSVLKAAGLALTLAAVAGAAHAQRRGGGSPYPEQTGEEIYKNVCQGCHMPDAKGAVGAGMYPALAGNKKLGAKAYPVMVIVRGQKAMPEFGTAFTDDQVAAVVNYVRTHFGNSYTDTVTAAEVKPLRPTHAGGEVGGPG
jgi:mono/diheme cytochrome c family protein